jgi:hypothetical protein
MTLGTFPAHCSGWLSCYDFVIKGGEPSGIST